MPDLSSKRKAFTKRADFIYMAPPFLAYYGAATKNVTVLRASVEQCLLYSDILLTNSSNASPAPKPPLTHPFDASGLWVHIIGPRTADPGIWSTGNAWAAAGMMRVLATLAKAPGDMFVNEPSASKQGQGDSLTHGWKKKAMEDIGATIRAILDASILLQSKNSDKSGGLLRNYMDDPTWFGEISGSTLLASVAYRLVSLKEYPLQHSTAAKYIKFAESIRLTLRHRKSGNHVTNNGTVTPAVNPLGWGDRQPWTAGSPEGQNFVVLMYAAWRDWVLGGKKV